jgi:hypothetical protein
MPYAFIYDVPATEAIYRDIKASLGDEPPAGLIVHLAMKRDKGLRYVDVWATEADWDRFRTEQADPAVASALASRGIPMDPSLTDFQAVEVIDTWLGATVAAAG